MFSLFHFSRVFPYIHPCLFPVEASKGTAAAPVQEDVRPAVQQAGAQEAPVSCPAGQGRKLKSLYRRHQLIQRSLTYSGTRHATW